MQENNDLDIKARGAEFVESKDDFEDMLSETIGWFSQQSLDACPEDERDKFDEAELGTWQLQERVERELRRTPNIYLRTDQNDTRYLAFHSSSRVGADE